MQKAGRRAGLLASAIQPLYATLSPDQQRTADAMLRGVGLPPYEVAVRYPLEEGTADVLGRGGAAAVDGDRRRGAGRCAQWRAGDLAQRPFVPRVLDTRLDRSSCASEAAAGELLPAGPRGPEGFGECTDWATRWRWCSVETATTVGPNH